jgi:hypothetical protein
LLLSFLMYPQFLLILNFHLMQKYPKFLLNLLYLNYLNSHSFPQSLMYPKYPYLMYPKYQKFDHSFLKSLKHHRLRYLPK